MKACHSRILRIAAPWLIGLSILIGGFWFWDSKNYPIPKALDSSPVDPFADPVNLNVVEKSAIALRKAKEERFWDSFQVNGTKWKATHWWKKTTATVRFTENRIFVDPPDLKIGIPFVNDTEYEMLDTQVMEAVVPVPGEGIKAVAKRKRVSFEDRHPDGKIYLQTTADDDFWLEILED